MKLRAFLLAGLMALSLTACGNRNTNNNKKPTGTENPPATTQGTYESDGNGSVGNAANNAAGDVERDANDMVDGAADVVEDAGNAVTNAAGDVVEGAADVVEDTTDTARRVMDGGRAKRKTTQPRATENGGQAQRRTSQSRSTQDEMHRSAIRAGRG